MSRGIAITREELAQRLQFLSEVFTTETALFHQAAAEKLGLGVSDTKTLSALLQEGPMTAGEITRRLGLTTGAVTSVIDRLEQRGFVTRGPDPDDRRKVVVTANGPQLHETAQVYASIGQGFQELLQHCTTEQLAFLARFYEDAIELTKQENQKLQ